MKFTKRYLLSFAFILFGYFAQSQIKITGSVLSRSDNKSVARVSVTVKGSMPIIGATTDNDGRFTITIPGGIKNPVLTFSSVGYLSREFKVGKAGDISVVLDESSTSLEDVVIIGYTAITPKNSTGSISTLGAKALKDVTLNSAEQALTGRLAGVQVTTAEGSLDADVKIVIRGGGSITQDNSPLYIIDGVQVEDGLRSVSPQDIERIDILKDAAATAIYGSRGANGVVLVVTKGGKIGAGTVSYNGFAGLSLLSSKLEVMNPYEFIFYQWERAQAGSATDRTTFASVYGVNTFADMEKFKSYEIVDWQKEVMGNTGLNQTHNVSASGGTKATKYNFSYTNNNTEGILLNTNYKRNLFNVKVDQTVSEKFRVGFTLRYADTKTNGAGISDAGNAQVNGLRNFVKYKPFINNAKAVDEFDEEYFNLTNQGGGLGLANPVAWTNAKYRKGNSTLTNLGGYITYSFNDYFSLRSTLGINSNQTEGRSFNDALRSIGNPSTAFSTSIDKTLNQSNVLTYTNGKSKSKFAKNNDITILLGQEIFISQGDDLYNQFMDYPRGITAETALSQLTQGTVVPGFPNKDYNKSTLLSFFGRANYTLKDKYIASLTVRADGSSKFSPENKWGYFPSASIAWRLSQEEFMKKFNLMKDIKLRLSYGTSGNNRIRDYAYLSSYVANQLYGLNNSVNTFGYQSTYLANPNLKWETTVSKNLGLDFSVLKNKLLVSIDVYSNITKDVITSVAITPTTGYSSQLQNTANTWNRGVEIQLAGPVLKTKKFEWDANFNISFNKNTIKELSSGLDSYLQYSGWSNLSPGSDYIVKVGAPVGSIYGYVSDGFYTVDDFDYDPATTRYTLKAGVPTAAPILVPVVQPGSIKVKDLSGNGIIGDEDKTIIGDATPKFFGGLNQQFTYKNFDASIFVNFQVGNDILNANKIEFTNGYLNNNNLLQISTGRWRTVDTDGNLLQKVSGTVVTGVAPDILRAANASATLWQPIRSTPGYTTNSWAVEDGSFLRVNNISLGYTFTVGGIIKKSKIKKLRVYATANNLAILTSYSGYDPEVNTRRATGVTPGVDYSAYPRNKTYVFGLNLSL